MNATGHIKPKLTAFVICAALFCFFNITVMLPGWTTLWSIWHEKGSSYSHGTIVALVAIWLVHDQWGRLQKESKVTSFQLCLTLASGLAGGALWSLGELTGISTLYWLSMPMLSCALFLACSSKAATFKSIAPFIALYFALPVWELLVPSLQMLAVAVVRAGIHIIDIPAFIQGINVNIPGGRFVVEGGCSGVRYLLVSIAITSLWGYLYIPSKKYTALLIATAALISIITNWIRIFLIIIIGYQSQMKSSIVYDHEFFGWILFAIALLPIMFLAMKLEKKADLAHKNKSSNPEHTIDDEVKPEWNIKKGIPLMLLLALLPMLSQFIEYSIPALAPPTVTAEIKSSVFDKPQQVSRAPEEILSQSQKTLGGWLPDYPGIENWSTFHVKPSNMQILVGHISRQRESHELFSSTNSLEAFNASQWAESIEDNTLYLRNIYSQKWVGRIFYRVGGSITDAGLKGKLQQLTSVLQMRNDAQLIIAGFKCDTDCSTEKQLLNSLDTHDFNQWLKDAPTLRQRP